MYILIYPHLYVLIHIYTHLYIHAPIALRYASVPTRRQAAEARTPLTRPGSLAKVPGRLSGSKVQSDTAYLEKDL